MSGGAEWHPYDRLVLSELKIPDAVVNALSQVGLPVDTYKMFLRVPHRELELREISKVGQAVFLGDYEDGEKSYWLSAVDGSVWMAHGYAGTVQEFTRINSSAIALQRILGIWDGFIGSGVYEGNCRYESLVTEVVDQAHAADPSIFEDEESWWSRVFEEIEYGVLAPE